MEWRICICYFKPLVTYQCHMWFKDRFISMINSVIFSYFEFPLFIPYLSLLSQCTRVSLVRRRRMLSHFIICTSNSSPIIDVPHLSYILKNKKFTFLWASLITQLVKNSPTMQETLLRFLGGEDPLEKGKATLSSILT